MALSREGEVLVPPVGRLVGVDLGSRRVGVATCDSGRRLASGLTVIHRVGDRLREHRELGAVVEEYAAVGVIVGLPLSLSGEIGPAAAAVIDEVGELVERLGVPVETHDERFTTVSAAGALAASGRRGRKQRALVDQVAAAMILQSWLDGPGTRR
jgi:putative Holliday junction resolvase